MSIPQHRVVGPLPRGSARAVFGDRVVGAVGAVRAVDVLGAFVAAVAVLVMTAMTALVGAPVASAHAALRSSTPADGSVVDTLPENYELTFNENVDPNFAQVVIADATGGTHAQSGVTVRGASVTGAFPQDLPTGRTEIRFRIVSADGHPVSGAVSFDLRASGPAPAQSPTTTPTAAATTEPTTAPTTAPTTQAAPTPDTSRGAAVGNVTMLALGGLGLLVFALIVFLLARHDRRG